MFREIGKQLGSRSVCGVRLLPSLFLVLFSFLIPSGLSSFVIGFLSVHVCVAADACASFLPLVVCVAFDFVFIIVRQNSRSVKGLVLLSSCRLSFLYIFGFTLRFCLNCERREKEKKCV